MGEEEAVAQSVFENKKVTKPTAEQIEEKKKKIKKVKNKLKKKFKETDKNKLDLIEKLIEEVAFMSVTLEETRKYIEENGIKEFYMNGKGQFGYKESVESKNYNVMFKNYSNAIKQLNDYLPEEKKITEDDEFSAFNEQT